MRSFYWRTSTNFGDAMNSWLWDELFPGLMDPDDNIRLIGIGSLIKADLERVKGLKVIFGSGSGYASLPNLSDPANWKVYFVRGPLTAKAAKLPAQSGVVDAAWLVGLLDEFKLVPKKAGVCFIPHFSNSRLSSWDVVCKHAGIQFIDPLADSRWVISQIAKSELAITESLHGAIMADYYRTPWIPVQLSAGSFLDFKWLDWCRSVGVDARVYNLPPTDLFDHMRQGSFPSNRTDFVSKEIAETDLSIDTSAIKRTPSRWYMTKQRLRTQAHMLKHSSFDWLSKHRNPWGVRSINDRLTESLAVHLRRLTQQTAYLSSDRMREDRLQQLADLVAQLQRDYRSGALGSTRDTGHEAVNL
jgi:succinoglycan biosynthesis protein ExoV